MACIINSNCQSGTLHRTGVPVCSLLPWSELACAFACTCACRPSVCGAAQRGWRQHHPVHVPARAAAGTHAGARRLQEAAAAAELAAWQAAARQCSRSVAAAEDNSSSLATTASVWLLVSCLSEHRQQDASRVQEQQFACRFRLHSLGHHANIDSSSNGRGQLCWWLKRFQAEQSHSSVQ